MSISRFSPSPGNFGEEYVLLARTLPAAVITAASTVRHFLPIVASPVTKFPERLFFKGGSLVVGGATSSTTGAVTARAVKRTSGGTVTALSESVTIPSGTVAGTILTFPLLTTLTTANQLDVRPNDGETVCIEVTQAGGGTVTTQPGDVQAAVKMAVLS